MSMENCLRGQELALTRDFLKGQRSAQALFLAGDAAVYVRAAQSISQGKVATDYLGDFVKEVQASEKDDALYAMSPSYRMAYQSLPFLPPGRPSFVSYRSMVFPAWGAPVMLAFDCDSQGLAALRWSMLPWRAATIVAAGLLAFSLASRRKVLALALASVLVACDAQLSEAGSYFLTDVPGAALILIWLWRLSRLCARPSWRLAVPLGLFMGLAVLVKADLMYVLPASLLAAPLAVAAQRRTAVFRCVAIAALCHALVLGAWALRNHADTDAWFITSKDMVNLYLGNSPDAPGRNYRYGVSPNRTGKNGNHARNTPGRVARPWSRDCAAVSFSATRPGRVPRRPARDRGDVQGPLDHFFEKRRLYSFSMAGRVQPGLEPLHHVCGALRLGVGGVGSVAA